MLCVRGIRTQRRGKVLFSRWPEVYAGSRVHRRPVDRIIDYLEQTGQLENTIVLYCADNGASGERSAERVGQREQVLLTAAPDGLSENMKYLNTLGSPDLQPLPDRLGGGFSDAVPDVQRTAMFAAACPRSDGDFPAQGIKAKGECAISATTPPMCATTVLDVAEAPDAGYTTGSSSTRSTGVDALQLRLTQGSTTRERRYYAMLGTEHLAGRLEGCGTPPISNEGVFDRDRWGALPRRRDRSESTNVAESAPGQTQGAHRRLVRGPRTTSCYLSTTGPPPRSPHQTAGRAAAGPVSCYAEHRAGARGCGGQHRGRSTRSPPTSMTRPDADGVIFAHGSRFGGHTMFIKDGPAALRRLASWASEPNRISPPAI